MAISVCAYRPGRDAEEVADPDDISEIRGRDDRLIWVDLLDPSDADLARIAAEFELHHLALEDAKKHGQRPKLERYPTHAFLVAYSGAPTEVDVFIGRDWLVTVRDRDEAGEPWSLDGARARFERTRPENATVGFLLYVLLDELVDGYFGVVEDAEDRLEVLEERLFAESHPDERTMQRDLFAARRDLLEFRRRVVPLREVVSALLHGEVSWLDDATLVHLQDVHDHVLRATELLDEQRELLGNVMEAQLALASNHMNRVMKTMTSWGALLLGATLVAGIYGMNFEHMPELDWKLGYPFALGVMAVSTILGYRAFKRRDWL
ncbi:MAG: magnesium/cobalt transporter CorA [Actinomycetota bacterium]|nr:magnesium/cobalt transporter CorA [Actinomycetota bacterium]MDQ3679859.1 magnesium/cobalt transporter CorA [Actinomycetota bacterium]